VADKNLFNFRCHDINLDISLFFKYFKNWLEIFFRIEFDSLEDRKKKAGEFISSHKIYAPVVKKTYFFFFAVFFFEVVFFAAFFLVAAFFFTGIPSPPFLAPNNDK
jgi:hypothetical protein